jgi:hypothetical protein
MLANALTPQRKITHRRRSSRRSSVFGDALGNAVVAEAASGPGKPRAATPEELNAYYLAHPDEYVPDTPASGAAAVDSSVATGATDGSTGLFGAGYQGFGLGLNFQSQFATGGLDTSVQGTSSLVSGGAVPQVGSDVPTSQDVTAGWTHIPTAAEYEQAGTQSPNGTWLFDSDGNLRDTTPTLVVTGHPQQDATFFAWWDWARQNHMPGPPTTGGVSALAKYGQVMYERSGPASDTAYANVSSSGRSSDSSDTASLVRDALTFGITKGVLLPIEKSFETLEEEMLKLAKTNPSVAPDATEAAGLAATLRTGTRVLGGSVELFGGLYEFANAKDSADQGHAGINMAVGAGTIFDFVAPEVAIAWGLTDLAVQAGVPDFSYTYGASAGQTVSGWQAVAGWLNIDPEAQDQSLMKTYTDEGLTPTQAQQKISDFHKNMEYAHSLPLMNGFGPF